jgi:hypothetical protein
MAPRNATSFLAIDVEHDGRICGQFDPTTEQNRYRGAVIRGCGEWRVQRQGKQIVPHACRTFGPINSVDSRSTDLDAPHILRQAIIAEEFRLSPTDLTPKEQPPRKLSGKETAPKLIL